MAGFSARFNIDTADISHRRIYHEYLASHQTYRYRRRASRRIDISVISDCQRISSLHLLMFADFILRILSHAILYVTQSLYDVTISYFMAHLLTSLICFLLYTGEQALI